MWRAPQGLRGLAGLRGDAPSAARGVGDERAGRPCGARNKGDAARIDQVSASRRALVPGYQAPPPPTGTAARPCRPRMSGHAVPGTKSTPRGSQESRLRSGCVVGSRPRHRPRAPQPGLAGLAAALVAMGPVAPVTRSGDGGRGDENGADPCGPAPLLRGIEPAGESTATCRPGSARRRSFRPSQPGRPRRSRVPHEDRRWYGRLRRRERRAASEHHRADRRASCRPS